MPKNGYKSLTVLEVVHQELKSWAKQEKTTIPQLLLKIARDRRQKRAKRHTPK